MGLAGFDEEANFPSVDEKKASLGSYRFEIKMIQCRKTTETKTNIGRSTNSFPAVLMP